MSVPKFNQALRAVQRYIIQWCRVHVFARLVTSRRDLGVCSSLSFAAAAVCGRRGKCIVVVLSQRERNNNSILTRETHCFVSIKRPRSGYNTKSCITACCPSLPRSLSRPFHLPFTLRPLYSFRPSSSCSCFLLSLHLQFRQGPRYFGAESCRCVDLPSHPVHPHAGDGHDDRGPRSINRS